MTSAPSVILGSNGQPARKPVAVTCPRCGAGPEKRSASSGFGTPHPVCSCGHEWPEEVWSE